MRHVYFHALKKWIVKDVPMFVKGWGVTLHGISTFRNENEIQLRDLVERIRKDEIARNR